MVYWYGALVFKIKNTDLVSVYQHYALVAMIKEEIAQNFMVKYLRSRGFILWN